MAKIIPFPTGGDYDSGNGHGNGNGHGGADHGAGNGAGDESGSERTAGSVSGLFGYELGLSDEQFAALLSRDRQRRETVFEIAPELRPEDCPRIPVLRRAVALLQAVAEGEPLKSTAAGNLPQKLVRQLFAGEFSDAEPDFVRVNRENDSKTLSYTRRLCTEAGLLTYRNKEFRLTKAARQALTEEDLSAIYGKLLDAHLARPELIEEYDRYNDGGAVAAMLPLLLFAARDSNHEFLYEEEFAWLMEAVAADPPMHWMAYSSVIRLRFFVRFAQPFGLLEPCTQYAPPPETSGGFLRVFGRPRRRTALFDRVFRWHVAPPPRAVKPAPLAAAEIMDVVHTEPDVPIDGSENPWIGGMCMRALERCPDEADAYVVLARLFEFQPERALRIAELGLKVTAEQKPNVPEGASAWEDHLFRDVLRLHFTRAEILHELEEHDAAFAAFERLLELDPVDGMRARDYYVAALLESGRYERADTVCRSAAAEQLPLAATYWNGALAAFAVGDRTRAESLLAEALQSNEHVAQMIVSDRPMYLPPFYSPGDRNEATIYAGEFGNTWRIVPGALAWLRNATRER